MCERPGGGARLAFVGVEPSDVLGVLRQAASAVASSLDGLEDWGLAGTRDGQYRSDLVADRAALEVIAAAGFAALSEESGMHPAPGVRDRDLDRNRDRNRDRDLDREDSGAWLPAPQTTGRDLSSTLEDPIVVVVDPVDGSTNASRGLPWWASSLCALDRAGPLAAVVVNQATGTSFDAVRGQGAFCNGCRIRPSEVTAITNAVLAFSGYPTRHLGWSQYRSLGAAALDICAVASGALDGFVDCAPVSLAPWDYMAALLICTEAGASIADAQGRNLVVLDWGARRAPVAAATPELLSELVQARAGLG